MKIVVYVIKKKIIEYFVSFEVVQQGTEWYHFGIGLPVIYAFWIKAYFELEKI